MVDAIKTAATSGQTLFSTMEGRRTSRFIALLLLMLFSLNAVFTISLRLGGGGSPQNHPSPSHFNGLDQKSPLLSMVSVLLLDSESGLRMKLRVPSVQGKHLSFQSARPSFIPLNFSRLEFLSDSDIEERFLNALPDDVRDNARRHVHDALILASKYQLDPFWVISVIWTESHFREHVVSSRGAFGLMQLMPDTERELLRSLSRQGMGIVPTVSPEYNMDVVAVQTRANMERGMLYLKRLLEDFDYDFAYATVAYNMGPTRVKSWSRSQRSADRHMYLRKVKRAYRQLVSGFEDVWDDSGET